MNLGWRERWIRLLVRNSGQGRARGILRVWPVWEALAHRIWPAVPIPGSKHNWFRLHFGPYKGRAIRLQAIEIEPGDPVGEIHFDNRTQLRILGDARGTEKWAITTIFQEELTALADWMARPDFPFQTRAVFGVTLLSRAAARFGLTVRPRPSGFRARLDGLFLSGLIIIYGSEGADRMSIGHALGRLPAEVWIGKDDLLRRFASMGTRPGDSFPIEALANEVE